MVQVRSVAMRRLGMTTAVVLLLAAVAVTSSVGRAQAALAIPKVPSHTAIADTAHILDDTAEQSLSQKLIDYKTKTGNELAILTVPSLQGEDDFDYSYKVAQTWGIGSKQANNGVLLFVAVDDRAVRIQVGRGLEPYLTDVQCGRIIQQKIIPPFKTGDYTAGIQAGIDSIISVIGGERLSSSSAGSGSSDGAAVATLASYVGIVVLGYIGSFLARSKSWWAGGLIGAVPGVLLFFTVAALVATAVLLGGLLLGLLLDYLLSKNYRARKAAGQSTSWWGSGGGFFGGSSGGSGSGGFGGFSGGSFGGGGAGGRW